MIGTRFGLQIALAVTACALCLGCQGGWAGHVGSADPAAALCRQPPPFAVDVDHGTISGPDLEATTAVRDGSMTLVSYCSGVAGVMADVGPLTDDGAPVWPIGGAIRTVGSTSAQDLIYPATVSTHLMLGSSRSGNDTLSFARAPLPEPCGEPGPGAITWVACGSILVVDWQTDWLTSVPLTEVDGHVLDTDGADLGFYVIATRAGSSGVVVRLGFQRPAGALVSLQMEAATSNGQRVRPSAPIHAVAAVPARARRAEAVPPG